MRASRSAWLEKAKQGHNPLLGESAPKLADDPEEEGYGWLR